MTRLLRSSLATAILASLSHPAAASDLPGFLEAHCLDCHSGETSMGEFPPEPFEAIHPHTWERVLIAADKTYVDSEGSFTAVLVSLLTSDSFLYRE